MIKKYFFSFFGLLATVALVGGVYVLMIQHLIAASAGFGLPPESVALYEVEANEWETTLSAVGSVVAVQGISVSAEAEGVVRTIAFEAGGMVEAGDLLVELDTEVEQTELRSAQAAADLARVNYQRAQDLFDSRTISQSELDSSDAAVRQSEAQVDNIRARIAKKTIRAPFSGRLGIRYVSLGQFLNKGQAIVSLQAADPVYVEFSLPQQVISKLEVGLKVRAMSDAFSEQVFEGTLTALNPQIDQTTRNLKMQATFSNTDGNLRPGMFVSVEVVRPEMREVIVVPNTAVIYATYGDSVFVVEKRPDGTQVAQQRLVRTSDTRGDFVVITTGLSVGERVVMSGAFKLRNGMVVVEETAGVAVPSLNPTPADS